MYYLCFDAYYDYNLYNEFIANARKNKLEFKEYLSTQSQYRWYIELQYQKDFPKFLKYDVITDSRYLLEKITPLNTSDENYLLRKQRIVSDIEKFVSPKVFREAKYAYYACIFKYQDIGVLKRASLNGVKSYILGKQKGYKLAISLHKKIKDYINSNDIFIEKRTQSDYSKPCELELTLNQKFLNGANLTNKMIHYPYVEDGSLHVSKYPTGFFQ